MDRPRFPAPTSVRLVWLPAPPAPNSCPLLAAADVAGRSALKAGFFFALKSRALARLLSLFKRVFFSTSDCRRASTGSRASLRSARQLAIMASCSAIFFIGCAVLLLQFSRGLRRCRAEAGRSISRARSPESAPWSRGRASGRGSKASFTRSEPAPSPPV